mmetsp:Transcript_44677/g.54684  ORF Transcript_44677/g.54684 Transcript_44677/m.54684 type:complete len:186 (+) Transcript_44677:47-604(+)
MSDLAWDFSENGNKDNHFRFYQKVTKIGFNDIKNDKLRPIGYISGDFDDNKNTHMGREKDREKILLSQAWNQAKAPSRQILMSGIMMWMSGSNLTIFTLMMMGMVMLNPLTALFSVNKAFERYDTGNNSSSLRLPKLAYIVLNFVSVGIGIWKLNSLGLLPTGQHIPPTIPAPTYLEFSQGMIIS